MKEVSYIKRSNANSIGQILSRNCLLKHVIEGKREARIEVTGRRGKRHKHVMYKLKKTTGYCK